MEISLLDFVQEWKQLAKQALGKHAGKSASGGLARWKLVVIHCIRIEDNHTYREVIDRISLINDAFDVLETDSNPLSIRPR